MSSMIENEIREAIQYLEIEEKVKEYKSEERKRILQKIKEVFVRGDPRVWWLSLKYVPKSFVFEQEFPYMEIARFFDEKEALWFIIEDIGDDDQLLYKTSVSNVIDIISNCAFFEYNVVSENCEKYLCENDHNEFLYIDIRENPVHQHNKH